MKYGFSLHFFSKFRLPLCFSFLLILTSASAMAQSIEVGSATGAPGSAVSLPVGLNPGSASISTVQVDVMFSSALAYAGTTTGPAASAAGKSAGANPIPGGVRILVFGLNSNAISAGVIATIQLNISPSAPAGSIPVTVTGIVASDPAANAVAVSGIGGSVTILGGSTDTTPPVITQVSSSGVTATSATISWVTNEAADSQVEYGTTAGYGSSTSGDATLSTSHVQGLSGLTANTLYHYRVKSKDAAGNLATSGDYTFTTAAAADSTPPTITGVAVSDVTADSAAITWITNEAADSQVQYGTTAGYGSSTALNSTLSTSHAQILGGLTANTTYHYRVRSSDAAGNTSVSGDYTFTTLGSGQMFTLTLPRFSSTTSAAAASGQNMSQLNKDNLIGMALANIGSEVANLTFTAMDSAGNLITGPGIVNPRPWVLNPKSQIGVLDSGIFGDAFTSSGTKGWIKLETTNPDVRGFFLAFDPGLTLMDGANFGTAPMTDFVFTEIEPAGSTRINVANGNIYDANVTFNLMRADGSVRSSVSRVISGNGALVADLYGDLFNGTQADPADYVRMHAGQGVAPFELMQKSVGDIASLTGQDVLAGGTTLYSPQYVIGGAWKTTLSIVNLDYRTGSLTLRFIGEDGIQIGTTRVVTIGALGKLRIDDPAFFKTLAAGEVAGGYVEIVSDGIRLAGSTVFGDSTGQTFESALPLIYGLQNSVLFSHIASNDLYFTGIAVLNPNAGPASVTIEIYDASGNLIGLKPVSIPARQRSSGLLTQYFESLVGKDQASGYIRINSSLPIASFALFGTNNLSVLSAIPPQ